MALYESSKNSNHGGRGIDMNVKVFAVVSAFATLCITVVSLYAIKKDAAWALFGIIAGIFGACITIAVPVASAIRVKMKQSKNGEAEVDFAFQGKSRRNPAAQQKKSYSFSLTEGQTYEFPERLFGADRYAYTFKISEIWVMDEAAKFAIKIQRHGVGEEPQTVTDEAFGLQCDECIQIDGRRWQLTLDNTEHKTARFCVKQR